MKYDVSSCTKCQPVISAELQETRRRVADLLLHFPITKGQHRHLSQSQIAMTLGTSWNMVYDSLISLKGQGAIKIDRNRMAINKQKLTEILTVKE